MEKKLQASEGVVLIERSQEAVEFFIFAGHEQSKTFNQLYLNHLSLLNAFGKHIKRQLNFILKEQEKESFTLVFSNKKKTKGLNSLDPIKHFQLLHAMGNVTEWHQAESLTAREKDCLKALAEGHSIKGIGLLLSLSPRTVEYYLINAKNKLNCWTKEDFLSKLKLLIKLNLL